MSVSRATESMGYFNSPLINWVAVVFMILSGINFALHFIAWRNRNPLFSLLLPAFVTSELKTAFQIGFLLLVPFLVIDLVVASVLMSVGMVMLSPLIISLPFKIMLFVLVDGWSLVMTTLAGSFLH